MSANNSSCLSRSEGAEIVVLAAARTPIGAFQGGLSSLPVSHLGAAAIRRALEQSGLSPDNVSDVILGNVLQAGQGQAPARQAALAAGLPPSVSAVTVGKVCGSGLQAIRQGAHALAAGDASLVIAGGMESMSAAPYLLPKAREGFRLGHQQVVDSLVLDGLWDPHNNLHMGSCAEHCARHHGLTREMQDAYAVTSFQRANAAQAEGAFFAEIAPVEFTDSRGKVVRVEQDEGPGKVNYEKLPTLRPAFEKSGTVTAANASTLNDGAAALVLCSAVRAQAAGIRPIARLVAFGSHAQEPLWFSTAPIEAARIALRRAGWVAADVDLWEVNEAFAVVPLVFMRELDVPLEKMNVRGGAIALGHPIGASGARIVVTLISALRARGLKRGLAAVCIGGGEGLAVCVEIP